MHKQLRRWSLALLAATLLVLLLGCAPTTQGVSPLRSTTPGSGNVVVPSLVMHSTPDAASDATPAVTPASLRPAGGTGRWHLVFQDAFAGSRLDTRKWTTCFFNFHVGARDCTHNQDELELYQPANVSVRDGVLRLTARHQQVRIDGKTYQYTSGMISSGPSIDGGASHFAFRYGFVQMRARVPAGQGYWPAFWLLPANEAYPPEIDVCEILGQTPWEDHLNYHWANGDPEGADLGSTWDGPNFSAGWHVFGLDWEAGTLTWYVDGLPRFQVRRHVTSTPMYLIANLAVGGDWPGAPDATTPFPASFQIDDIRVWQHA
jgi:beta-glucanase (GH16 family)